jgi:ABC-type nitrate/sulfonate/bicarbonate transport system permease component
LGKARFYRAVGGTLWRSLYSFLIAFAAAAVFAVAAHFWKFIADIIHPIVTVCRAAPTIAVILILVLCIGGGALPAAVAFLVVFPLCYENLRSALDGIDPKLLRMADSFGVPKGRQVLNIYLPGAAPAVFSSVIASFGLNIKVVIASEILGLPTVSIGYMLLNAKQGFDFESAFLWLVVAVLLGFICECLLRLAAYLAMPWKRGTAK